MAIGEIKKQVSLYFPLSEFRAIRAEAARRRIPITQLCLRWMAVGLDELREREAQRAEQLNSSSRSSALST